MSKRQQAVEFFVQQGWAVHQSCGVVANLEAESGLRPDAIGDGGKAYGIAQWHPDRQSRFAGLLGRPIQGSSFEDQLYFVHAELQGEEKRAGQALAACTTAAEAGACVSRLYERPADREGEATKRAALAERVLAQCGGASQNATGEAIPVPEAPREPAAPDVAPPSIPTTEQPMPAILATLLPTVLGMFAPRAQAALGKITGQPADVLNPFLQQLFAQIGQVTQVGEVKTDAQAIAAVAELQKLKEQNSALVDQVEAHALDYLDKLAPLFDRLAAADAAENAAALSGRNAALERAIRDPYDVAPMMVRNVTQTSNWLLGGLVGATALAMVLKSLFTDIPDYVSMLLPVIGLLAGQISKERGAIISYRFDGTPAANASAAINGQIVQAGAVQQAKK